MSTTETTPTVPVAAATQTSSLVAKLWSYCNVLRDNGLSTIEYVEQLSYLLFLKMADEIGSDPFAEETAEPIVPRAYDWKSLVSKRGEELETHYRKVLAELGKHPGTTLGTIFAKAQNRITEPALLEKLVVELIGKTDWVLEGTDLKGDAYEGLLAKGAEDTKTGAGQYFTPRPLIDAMVQVMQPGPEDTITDPACGTAGFLIAAHSYIREHHLRGLSREQRLALGQGSIWGNELVPGTSRLAAMNMLLHGIGEPGGDSLITTGDALADTPSRRASLVLANPPFGKKSAITVVGTDGKSDREEISYDRSDFRATTTNKQLNFLQHIMSLMEMGGRAAVVLPDNVLFEAGAGEKIRRRLLQEFNLHTILRLPKGIFYAGGVMANVLFFEKKPPRPDDVPNTPEVWVYDFRTGVRFTLKKRPLRLADLADFIEAYKADDRSARKETEDGRFRRFTYEELIARDMVNLDIAWMKDPALDDADSLLSPDVIAQEIVEDLQAALAEFEAIAEALGGEVKPDVAAEEAIAET
ncbi:MULTISPECIES: class I SAM-dependent DNA methyltransferase [unclassified Streptomyces]|uniref:class I SAM-dependent DNA methyltransferase n=1 Tax=unclassified Streptomyces TaxID=2593676 RepID=UPI001904B7E7|nr:MULTISPECIES: class I SAM-dependent DNA methyltransferase [unclassified Streptomyces]MCU4748088.1 type I restriction-modification system subunit M [Streptomyces sp. G-5]QQN78688.1 SAM-dependent DNA methyltransferase [Streptomyces sp. XC 2026]